MSILLLFCCVILVFLNLMVELFGGIAHYLCSVSIPLNCMFTILLNGGFHIG